MIPPILQDTIATATAEPETDVPRLLLILALAAGAHVLIRMLKAGADLLLGPSAGRVTGSAHTAALRRHPKLATLLSLFVSAAIFAIWFVALGLVLGALGVDLTAYFATATVIGLAVGFGSQGLVQDVVIGLTLIFTDAMDVGDTVEVSGQVGRVERIGLRFTTLTNFLGQTVFIPNRNIAVVGRYRRGVVRAYVDVQLPQGADPDDVAIRLRHLAHAFRAQHAAVVLSDPEISEVRQADPDAWRYIRLKLRIWPGQQPLVETAFRQRVVGAMKGVDEGYADWMVNVTYRVAS